MQLVQSRPIPLPCFRDGGWYDDFAVTGAKDTGYSASLGTKTITPNGILLSASSSGTTIHFYVPPSVNYANFEAEYVVRLVSGAETYFLFRRLDANNYWALYIISSGQFILKKYVNAVNTTMGTISNIQYATFNRVGIRAIGSQITIFLNGKQIFNINNADVQNGRNFTLGGWDKNNGVAQNEYQYIAIRPL